MTAERRVDVVVVGAGPAGSMAAARLAQAKVGVLLVEKKSQVGVPVRCAEGVGGEALRKYVSIQPRWVSAQVKAVRLHAPAGGCVQLGQDIRGLVLDRTAFDADLARQAVEEGAKLTLRTYAHDLLMDGQRVRGVRLRGPRGDETVPAKLVIAADGVESRVARWAGIETALALKDVEVCAQYLMEGLKIDPTRCDFHFGREVAPGGYAWIFPKGPGAANVGLGVSGDHAAGRSAKEYLDAFVQRMYPEGRKVGFVAGAVPVSRPLKKPYAPGLMVIGDAARQSNPISGGGIIPALEAGCLAAEVARQALAEDDVSLRALSRYQRAWRRSLGRSYERAYRIKEAVVRLSDETLNATARALKNVRPEDLTLFRIFLTALRSKPSLILDLRHLFLPGVGS
jgi:digeranylgeranylglycerophospholipid reductase